jgi:Transposase DDE domain
VDLCGPTPGNHRGQFQQGRGCDLSSFQIDWEAKQAHCPGGKHSAHWRPAIDHRGKAVVNITFAKSDCSSCPHLRQCTTATGTRRFLSVRIQPLHEPYKRRGSENRRRSSKHIIRSALGLRARSRQGCGRSGYGARAIWGRRKPPSNISPVPSPSTWYGLVPGGRAWHPARREYQPSPGSCSQWRREREFANRVQYAGSTRPFRP